VDCFRLDAEGMLTEDYSKTFDFEMTADVAIAGHSGSAAIEFSPDGKHLAVLSKGSVTTLFPLSGAYAGCCAGEIAIEVAPAGLYIFPVQSSDAASSYGEPKVLEMDTFLRPYDFVWDDESQFIWAVGLPDGLSTLNDAVVAGGGTPFEARGANVISFGVSESSVPTQIGFVDLGFKAACWIDYRDGYIYTSNNEFDNDISIFSVDDAGAVDLENGREHNLTNFVSNPDTGVTGPLDFAYSGAKTSGKQFLYTRLDFTNDIVIVEFNADGSLTEVGDRMPVPGSGSNENPYGSAIVATTLSMSELADLYAEEVTTAPTPGPADVYGKPSSAGAMSTFQAFAATMMVLLL